MFLKLLLFAEFKIIKLTLFFERPVRVIRVVLFFCSKNCAFSAISQHIVLR